MSGSVRTLLTTLAVTATAGSGLVLSAPAAVAGPPPESLTILTTAVQPVTSTTGKHLILTVNAVRHSNSATKPDTHSKGTLTVTLANLGDTETHAWTFNLAKNSFTSSPGADGHLKTGTQIAPYGAMSLIMSPAHKGVKHSCGAGDFEVDHKVLLKGSLKLKTHSGGANSWGVVKLKNTTLKGKLYSGHGPDNEEACGGFPPCVHGISWLASKGNITLSGDLVGAKGDPRVGTIRGNRFTDLSTPSNAFRIDEVTANASNQKLTKLNGKRTLSVVADPLQAAAGDAALVATGHSPYANGCDGGQEKGTLWNAKYQTADQPLTFTEEIFGPISISTTKSATFESYHVA